MDPEFDRAAFAHAVNILLELSGVPVSALVSRGSPIPSVEHLRAARMFASIGDQELASAREFAERERVLFDRACRQLAECRGVRALSFLAEREAAE